MLVIGRKPGQEVVIQTPDGHEIIVRVAMAEKGKVRLGITADRIVKIVRRELLTEAA